MIKYIFPPLISASLFILLGTFVLLKNRTSKTNVTFFSLCLATFIWQFSWFILFSFPYERLIPVLLKIGYSGVIFLPIVYYHFLMSFLNKENKIIFTAYIFGTIFLLLTWFTSLFTSGYYKYFWGYYPKASFLHPFYLVLLAFLALHGAISLFKEFKTSPDIKKRNQIKYILLSLIFFIPASLDFVVNYGVECYPFGFIFILVSLFIIAYAILKHHLLNIEVVIKKTFIYSILISIITILYFIVVYLLERIFSVVAGYHSIPLAIAIIALFSIMFTPLKNKIQRSIDKYFFKGTIDQIEREKRLLETELERSERLKTVSTLAAGMAHEIKNPLTSIKTFVEYVDKKYQDPEFKEKFKSIVPKEIDKITNIINQLLDYSKTDKINLKPYNIHNILNYVLDLYSNEFIKKHIKLNKSYNSKYPSITCDENQLKQAFINIILNSIEAMPEGGELSIKTQDINNTLEISIQDTGKGIPKEKLKDIFNPFYTTKEKGTGLGLFIVHQIIENNKGVIAIESGEGDGALVRVRFLVDK
ncbi:MAG: ATP-binding protein [Candidatus Omnitrophica bacterium]|nr:ATP-binding protein [Candidatus Omnitrophota bacterium]